MVVQSDQPHLVGLDPDILSTGLVFFHLKVVVPCGLSGIVCDEALLSGGMHYCGLPLSQPTSRYW